MLGQLAQIEPDNPLYPDEIGQLHNEIRQAIQGKSAEGRLERQSQEN
jgi:hypothetical protein